MLYNKRMKWKVINWTWYEDDSYANGGILTQSQIFAIQDEIKKNGYIMTGWHHQEGFDCVPVLSNGKKYLFTRRGFGALMAQTYGKDGLFDYSIYTDCFIEQKGFKLPRHNYFHEEKIRKLSSLNEVFKLNLKKKEIESILSENKVTLPYSEKIRYIDKNDKIEFFYKGRKRVKIVKNVIYKKNIEEKELSKIEYRYSCSISWEDKEKINDEYKKIGYIFIISFK